MARSLHIEEWRPVPGFPAYVASSHGRIARVVGHETAGGYVHVMLPGKLYTGHGHSVGAKPRFARKQFRVYAHHIIALAFLGRPPKGKTQVNHKDFDKMNNHPSNLEWTSQKENIAHWRAANKGVAQCDRPYKYNIGIWKRVRRLNERGLSIRAIARKMSSVDMTASAVRWILKSPKYREVA